MTARMSVLETRMINELLLTASSHIGSAINIVLDKVTNLKEIQYIKAKGIPLEILSGRTLAPSGDSINHCAASLVSFFFSYSTNARALSLNSIPSPLHPDSFVSYQPLLPDLKIQMADGIGTARPEHHADDHLNDHRRNSKGNQISLSCKNFFYSSTKHSLNVCTQFSSVFSMAPSGIFASI